jgi:biopolymer transport protein TolR
VELPSAGKVNSTINVTPLVDVVLVLLIIFMVVTPMLQKGPAVQLPVTKSPQKQPDDKDQILVGIDANKMLHINLGNQNEKNVAEDAFLGRMQEYKSRNPDSTVVIKGDARLEYGVVKKAMLAVKEAGFEKVGLITSKPEQQK